MGIQRENLAKMILCLIKEIKRVKWPLKTTELRYEALRLRLDDLNYFNWVRLRFVNDNLRIIRF